jgi:UDP-glucose 4-epimerase
VILITGGMGFIGLHTARRFLDAGENVVVTLFHTRREPDFIKDELGKRMLVERLDITSTHDVIDVVRKHKVTGVVHLAVPGLAALTPAEDFRANMIGLVNVLEAARIGEVRRVTLASSIAVYQNLPGGPYFEDALLPVQSGNATETYKKAWEIVGLHYASRTGMEVVSARLSGIYGPLYHTLANPMSRMCHAAAHGVAADFSGSRSGVPFEDDEGDFCYVKDCAAGLQLLQMAANLPNPIYNIAAGVGRTYGEFANAVRAVVPNAQIQLQPGRSPRAKPDPYLDCSRAAKDIGYRQEYPVERAAADYIDWLRKNPV